MTAGLPTITPYPLPSRAALPPNTASWRPDPERAVLLIHDMQQYFLAPFEAGFRDELVGTVADLREKADAQNVPVAYTAQPGDMTAEQRGLLRDFWGPGMRRSDTERSVVPSLTPKPGDWQFVKLRYSAFFRSDLLDRMRASGRDQLIIAGVYAHIGVLATALDAFTHDLQPFLPAEALGDFSEADHKLALDYSARRCAVVLPAEEVLA
ncbi:isochorismatase family protein [Streptomonospora salina]|uniref:Isochorismate hydrolase n=1 Tax=Streptomonospora salina TaxID=104205 RepID=A0A841EGP6_9ACTN|nr:isochorismatase family protein [Streptomonospora salina]MBB6000018.1 isochorismate hydrolase [Streptomonospora salina]